MTTVPSRDLELSLLKDAGDRYGAGTALPASTSQVPAWQMCCVGGIDEVGRGAIAGPLAVGVAVIDGTEGAPPAGLTDSKQLTPRRREAMFDYLSAPTDLFAAASVDQSASAASTSSPTEIPREVTTVVKGDGKSVVIAAASVLAKVTRDRLMSDLSDPGYGWAKNKGYASAQHLQAIAQMGLEIDHRLSWHLQGVSSASLAKAWRARRENRAQPPLVFSSQKG